MSFLDSCDMSSQDSSIDFEDNQNCFDDVELAEPVKGLAALATEEYIEDFMDVFKKWMFVQYQLCDTKFAGFHMFIQSYMCQSGLSSTQTA